MQVVGRAGSGVDNIDANAATRRGVVVVNAPEGNTIAAAEHTIGLMLALARHIPEAHSSLRGGKWARSTFMGVELRGKTLGIVGLGRVGSEVARRARGLEMRVIALEPFQTPERAAAMGVQLVDKDELLATSDFITLHAPLTAGSRNIIGAAELKLVKPDVRIINVARGGLVAEDALLEALDAGKVAGAAIDVFEQEPPPMDNPLLQHPKVIVTPHLGASTAEAQEPGRAGHLRRQPAVHQRRDLQADRTVPTGSDTSRCAGDTAGLRRTAAERRDRVPGRDCRARDLTAAGRCDPRPAAARE
jgi:D-3-phosphoglycerate dehydrogenase / 2-oxoglutarate reductase